MKHFKPNINININRLVDKIIISKNNQDKTDEDKMITINIASLVDKIEIEYLNTSDIDQIVKKLKEILIKLIQGNQESTEDK